MLWAMPAAGRWPWPRFICQSVRVWAETRVGIAEIAKAPRSARVEKRRGMGREEGRVKEAPVMRAAPHRGRGGAVSSVSRGATR